MGTPKWPRPPIHPEHLPLIRELLTAEEYEQLLRRIEAHANGLCDLAEDEPNDEGNHYSDQPEGLTREPGV